MNKHLLMLTAATAALLVGPAFAASSSKCDSGNDTDITSKISTPLCTSTAKHGKPGDITLESGATLEIPSSSAATIPAITIDSDNTVTLLTGSTVNYKDTSDAVAVQLDAGNTGQFENSGIIDLTGSGNTKTGILVSGKGTFTGDILLDSGSSLTIQGDSSTAISILQGANLDGDLKIDGSVIANSSSANSLSGGSVTGVDIAGNVTGNVEIGQDGGVEATGENAQGMLVTGSITGSLEVHNGLEAVGTTSPAIGKLNPISGSALLIGQNVGGGIFFGGPSGTSSGVAASTILSDGGSPTVIISPSVSETSTDIEIGVNRHNFSLYSRGNIQSMPTNSNVNSTAVQIGGGASKTIFDGGIFSSGTITATATSSDNTSSVPVFATGLEIAARAHVPNLVNTAAAGNGAITATISGPSGGTAAAIVITNGVAKGSLGSIVNSGTISASATTTATAVTTLDAYAIYDGSGKLTSITNKSGGTISAVATTLSANNQIAVAANLAANKTGVTFDNEGTITGDILFGTGGDSLTASGTSNNPASITGDIDFGGAKAVGDSLSIGGFGTVTGAITEDPVRHNLDISVADKGTLNLTNSDEGLSLHSFTASDGSTLGLTVSQAFNVNAGADTFVGPLLLASKSITIDSSSVNISYGSFLSPTGNLNHEQFVLAEAPHGQLQVSNLKKLQQDFTLPFLYQGGKGGGIVLKKNADTVKGQSMDQLLLSLKLKSAAQLGLTGYAAQLYGANGQGPATLALAGDNELGGAVISFVTDKAKAQSVFDEFAPNVSGETRSIAISITDQATGPVAARQRELRLYANQDGDATLWSQEFGESLNQDGTSGSPGFRNSGFGFALGMDVGNPQAGRYGAAFTFFSGSSNEKDPRNSRTDENWYMLTGYTDWRGRGFFLDTQASVGVATIDGKRTINLDTLTRTAEGKRNALMGALGATTGVVFNWGGTVLTPQISVDGLSMRENGYAEGGGGPGFDLHVAPYYANSLRSFAGVDLRQDVKIGDIYLQPEMRAGYRYDFISGATKLTANFVGDPNGTPSVAAGSPFSIQGPGANRGNFVGGASIATTTDTWSFGLNYDVLKSGGEFSQVGTISLIGRI